MALAKKPWETPPVWAQGVGDGVDEGGGDAVGEGVGDDVGSAAVGAAAGVRLAVGGRAGGVGERIRGRTAVTILVGGGESTTVSGTVRQPVVHTSMRLHSKISGHLPQEITGFFCHQTVVVAAP